MEESLGEDVTTFRFMLPVSQRDWLLDREARGMTGADQLRVYIDLAMQLDAAGLDLVDVAEKVLDAREAPNSN